MAGPKRPFEQPGKRPSGGADRLHISVAEALRQRVVAGGLPKGAKLPPLREIAREFDVSTMTVRQAIRRLEAQGCVHRIPGVGAFVTPSDPGKSETVRKMLTFAATDLSSAFEMGIARGVEKAGRELGWGVQILDAYHDADLEARNMLGLPSSGCRGALILPTWGDNRCVESLFALRASGFPIVVVDRIPPGLSADFVESDHEQGAYKATRHLIQHGHRRVFILTPPPMVSSIAARIQGYERALRTAGIEPLPEWKAWMDLRVQANGFRDQRKWIGGYQAILPVLQTHSPPLAVFAVDPYTAWGVYEACRELRLRIPQDLSIVGFDDSEVTLAMHPPITTMSQRTDAIGRASVELLDELVTNRVSSNGERRSYRHIVIDVDLVQRQSVAAPS